MNKGCAYCINFQSICIFKNPICKECMGNIDILEDEEKCKIWINNKPNFIERK